MDYRLVTIVLAAGESRRMGKPKLFLPLYGSTLLRLAVRAAADLERVPGVVVVTGAYDAEIRRHLRDMDNLHLVHNPDWPSGMAGSIAAGVKKAITLNPTHLLITLADQPGMGAESLAYLVDESLEYPTQIVATLYPGKLGVPAIFPLRFAGELSRQSGSFGARKLIAREGDSVRAVTFHRPPVDIDTPEDYARLQGLQQGETNKEAPE